MIKLTDVDKNIIILFFCVFFTFAKFSPNCIDYEISPLSFNRSLISLNHYYLLDNYNTSDPFGFSQKHYQLIWNSDTRKFQKYSKNPRQLTGDVCLFFHSEYKSLPVFFIYSLNRFHRVYHICKTWNG